MKHLDAKSSLVAGFVGAIAVLLMVQLFDYVENDQPALYQATTPTVWLVLGFLVGFSVQAAERLTGAS